MTLAFAPLGQKLRTRTGANNLPTIGPASMATIPDPHSAVPRSNTRLGYQKDGNCKSLQDSDLKISDLAHTLLAVGSGAAVRPLGGWAQHAVTGRSY